VGPQYIEAGTAAPCGPSYWQGTSHSGPDDVTAVTSRPRTKKNGLDTSAKKSVQTAEENP
jgi:hypothetical protein